MRGHDEGVQAAGSVVGATGLALKIRGATVARTGGAAAGSYAITLDVPLPAADAVMFAHPRGGAANANCQIAHTSDTVKTVTCTVGAGALADIDFDFEITRISVGAAS
ncbi:MAG: hypothetical protein V1784_07155 [bacterium]